jgi:hypothetical protein
LNTFLPLAAEKKYSKNGAAGKFFGPSYFDPTLEIQNKAVRLCYHLFTIFLIFPFKASITHQTDWHKHIPFSYSCQRACFSLFHSFSFMSLY